VTAGRLRTAAFLIGAVLVLFLATASGTARDREQRTFARARIGLPSAGIVAVLCYHDIAEGTGYPESTVSPKALREHIRRSRENGFVFLSLSELLSYRDRPADLPSRVMVLTFDDGYLSFFDRVLPILKEEGVKATLSVVSSFVDRPPAGVPPLMSWDQIREAESTGLVEIASHGHEIHRFETDNPYRDTGPSVTTRRFLLEAGRYEDRDEYKERIRKDFREARRILAERLGHEVTVLAWPYGEHNLAARRIAAEEGFATTLGLDGTDVRREDLLSGYLPRCMVFRGTRIADKELRWLSPPPLPVRAAQVDLDSVYDPDTQAFRRNLDQVVERVRRLGATDVFLQGCPDPDGTGFFRETYFMNHQAPVRADVWSMAAHKFNHAGLKVWIRAPTMNLSWEWNRRPDWRIPFRKRKGERSGKPWYFRISPDVDEARRAAIDFYTDIAVYLPIRGVLFDDDAFMLDAERLRSGPANPRAKSEAIRSFLEEIKGAVLAWRPNALFARNIYATVVERDGVHPGLSQEFGQFLEDYDLTVVMAYARMEGHRRDAEEWTESLVRRTLRRWDPPPRWDAAAPPVLIKFQTYDWEEEEWVPGAELAGMVRKVRGEKALGLGLYPVPPKAGNLPEGLLGIPAPAELSKRPTED
jgi:biofilm PGA synthesis lipoprotein PgaB